MEITHFDRLRINSDSSVRSVFLDVTAFNQGASSGFMAVAYNIPSFNKESYAKHKTEVRRKENQTGLFVHKYSDAEIPEWWRDAEILYSWEQE
ncbi:hypothetical protein BJP48_30305 [Paenibacillus odorifer]|uniref:hypothetical protein n=1 Tax=Paenibacillus sp. FSL L8-0499 TaxID=2975334 RepID=UPI00096C5CA7|nr:hypothetical protein BJP48_30305 [Paenibacillus odorifer]